MIVIIHLDEAVIVEGKYDKIKLESIIDAAIIRTDGFRIYKDKEKMALIRRYARSEGIIILTDSDTAGFRIRRYIKGAVGNGRIINVYIPDIFGKERRKKEPSKEGKLGVEGMDADIIINALKQAGVDVGKEKRSRVPDDPITAADMYGTGLSGGKNASDKRKAVLKYYGLPELLTTKAMTEILNSFTSRGDFLRVCGELFTDDTEEN